MRYWMASGQDMVSPWRDYPLMFVRNFVLAGSAWNFCKDMIICTSEMFNVLPLFKKRALKYKIWIKFVPSKMWFFMIKLRLLIWTLSSAISFDDLLSFVMIRRYDLYDICMLLALFAGLIELKPACGYPIVLQWNGNMFGIEESSSSYPVT